VHIVLLNWISGENNPFDYFNNQLKERFEEHGAEVDIVLVDDNLAKNIIDIHNSKYIHVVITHQGLVSNASYQNTGKSFWEENKIKLVCLHSDHPCHAPINHKTDSKYVTHAYALIPFTKYSNKYFSRKYPSVYVGFPGFFNVFQTNLNREGDYFVLPKNLDSINTLRKKWLDLSNPLLSNLLSNISEEILHNYLNADKLEHHEIIDKNIDVNEFDKILKTLNGVDQNQLFHYLHSELDKVYRNISSELVVKELSDVPLHINGRGWDEYKLSPSKYHIYNEFGEVKDGDYQFYSNYGIVDVSPHRHSLHDRTYRALAHSGGFLSNSRIDFRDNKGLPYAELFYSGQEGDLRTKVEAIMLNPKRHIERCMEFRNTVTQQEPFLNFFRFIYFHYLACIE